MGSDSKQLFTEAQRWIPGGVNSPVRAWAAVGLEPRFVAEAEGARIRDVEGRDYIDYVGSWGPMLLGHRDPAVTRAVTEAVARGTSFGAATAGEVELARRLCRRFASLERVRLVSSGTEATMSALRLARAATGRGSIIKFAGCYHGHSDGLLVAAGSGASTFGVPDSPGVPEEYAALTRVAEFNDAASVDKLCDEEVAAIIVEPVAANMGVVPPAGGFLKELRRLADERGALLIFDEVITGLRLGPGGYQDICGVVPDLSCLGKVIGGGLPVGAYGGKAALMDQIAPAGPVYQAGTLSGNPLAVAAGLATLDQLDSLEPWEQLEQMARRLADGIREELGRGGCVQRMGSMLTVFFGPDVVGGWTDADSTDRERFAAFFRALIDEGVWIPPSQFEAWFVSVAHTDNDIDRTIEAVGRALVRSG